MEFTASGKKSDDIVKPSAAPKFNMNLMMQQQQSAGKQQVNGGQLVQPQQKQQEIQALSPTLRSSRVNGKPQQQLQQIIQPQYQQQVPQFQSLGQQQQVGQLTLQQKVHMQLQSQQQQQQQQHQQQQQQTIQLQSQAQPGPFRLSSPYKQIPVQQQQQQQQQLLQQQLLPSREVQMLKAPLRATSPVRTVPSSQAHDSQTQNSFSSSSQQKVSSPRIQMNTFTQGFNIQSQPKQQIPLQQPQQFLVGQPRQAFHSPPPQRIELLNTNSNKVLPNPKFPQQTPPITLFQQQQQSNQQQQQDEIAGKMAAMDHKVSTLVSEINSLQILVIKKNKEAKYWKSKYDAIDQNIISFLSDEDHNKRAKKESPEKRKQSDHIDESEEDGSKSNQQQQCYDINSNKIDDGLQPQQHSVVTKLQKQLKELQQSLFEKEVTHKEQTDGLTQLLKQKDDYVSEYAQLNEELLKRIEAMGNNHNNHNNNNATQNSSSSIQSQQQPQETREQSSKQEKVRLSVNNSQGKSTNRRSVELSSGLALQAARIKLLESDLALKESANKSLEVENRQLNAQIHSLQTQILQLTQVKAAEKIALSQQQQQQIQYPSLITQSTAGNEINQVAGKISYQQELSHIASAAGETIVQASNLPSNVPVSASLSSLYSLKQPEKGETNQIEQWQQQQQKLKELVNHNNFMNSAAFSKTTELQQQQSTQKNDNSSSQQQQLQSVEQRLKQFSSFLSSLQGTKSATPGAVTTTAAAATSTGLTAPIQEQSKFQSISQYLTQQNQEQSQVIHSHDQQLLSSSASSLSPLDMLFQKQQKEQSSAHVQPEFNFLSPVSDYIPYSSTKKETLKAGS